MSTASESTVPVVLNRTRLNGVSAPEEFTTPGSFAVVLQNEGKPVHVHVRPDGPLAEAASVPETNQYVEANSQVRVPVNVGRVTEPVSGELVIVTGHGTESTRVAVTVVPEQNEPAPAESSGSGPSTTDTSAETDGTTDRTTVSAAEPTGGSPELLADPAGLLTVALAVGALVLALIVQVTIQSLVVTLGTLAVVLAVAAAVWILVRE